MIAMSAAPVRSASAHCEGTVKDKSYLPSSGPCVKPRTSGAVFRYCTMEMRSLFNLEMLAISSKYSRRDFPPRQPSFVVKRSLHSEAPKMLKRSRCLFQLCLLAIPSMALAARPDAAQTPTITEKTAGMQKLPGYFNLYWDAKQGKLWLEIDKWSTEFLYQSGLPAGIGSNDIGLDRGQLGMTGIVRFERSGPKILLIQENLEYRAVTNDADERRAVHDSFAESALWGFTVAAEENDHALVDATDFFLRDAHGIPAALRRTKQGTYHLDASRCAIFPPLAENSHTKNFPLNTEVEATLTFAGDDPGLWVRQVTPSPESITVREHHSFVQLPPPGYKPRIYDPRSSFSESPTLITRRRSANPSSNASPPVTGSRKKIRKPPSASQSSPSFTTSIAARRNPSVPRCSKARAGGIRPLRPPATRTLSAWNSCPKAPTSWTCVTTSSSGFIAPHEAGPTAPPSLTRAPAKSSKATSPSAP